MKIGELAARAGLRTSAIRYYEEAGLLPAPPRVSGRRDYDASAVTRLAMIVLCQRAGFTIAETRAIVRGTGEANRPLSSAWRRVAREKRTELDARIASLEAVRAFLDTTLACGCVRPDDCAFLAGALEVDPPRRLPHRRGGLR